MTRLRKPRPPFEPFAQEPEPLKVADFIATHPVFRLDELRAFYAQTGRDPASAAATLAYHVQTGRLHVIRRGVYGQTAILDLCLVASRMTPDAVLAYDGALSLHQRLELRPRLSFLTTARTSQAFYEGVAFHPVQVPRRKGDAPELTEQVVVAVRQGLPVRATSLERTLVDCADRMDLAPEPLELLQAFAVPPRLDFGALLARVDRLGSQVAAARTGLFLGLRSDVPREVELALMRRGPRAPTYLLGPDARGRGDRLYAPWNLILPPELHRALGT